MLRVEVLDEGKGVPYNQRGRLFQPFGQLQQRAGGTGLGLYSLSKRIEALNGLFGVDNKPDDTEGSLFWFSIPFKEDKAMIMRSQPLNDQPSLPPLQSTLASKWTRRPVDSCPDDSLPTNPSTQSPDAAAPDPTEIRLLLVDDVGIILKMMARSLIVEGATVEAYCNGLDCLAAYQKAPPGTFHGILTDIQMVSYTSFFLCELCSRVNHFLGVSAAVSPCCIQCGV